MPKMLIINWIIHPMMPNNNCSTPNKIKAPRMTMTMPNRNHNIAHK